MRSRSGSCAPDSPARVAAAVASVFALRLGPEGEGLVAVTFLVIVGTVTIYGLSAAPLAYRLGLAQRNPQGILFASAHPGARAIAKKGLLVEKVVIPAPRPEVVREFI